MTGLIIVVILLGTLLYSIVLGFIFHELSHFAVAKIWTDHLSLTIIPPQVIYHNVEDIPNYGLRLTAVAPQVFAIAVGIPLYLLFQRPYTPVELTFLWGLSAAFFGISPGDVLAFLFPNGSKPKLGETPQATGNRLDTL